MFQSPQPVLHTPLGRGPGSPLVTGMGTAPPLSAPPKSAARQQQENQERQYRANGGDVSIQGVHVSPSKALASRLAVAHGLDSDSALTPDHLPRAAREPVNNTSTVNLEVMLSYSSDEFGSVRLSGGPAGRAQLHPAAEPL